MKTPINLTELFQDSFCTFEVAKMASEAGFTCGIAHYAYDQDGILTCGSWPAEIIDDEMYPAINLPLAIAMLEDTKLSLSQLKCWSHLNEERKSPQFYPGTLVYCVEVLQTEIYEEKNLIDLLVKVWIKYKSEKQEFDGEPEKEFEVGGIKEPKPSNAKKYKWLFSLYCYPLLMLVACVLAIVYIVSQMFSSSQNNIRERSQSIVDKVSKSSKIVLFLQTIMYIIIYQLLF